MSEIITVPESYKTYKPKKFDRWDSLVEQYKREHPDKINKNSSADVRKKRKGRGRHKEDSKGQNQNSN